MRHAGGSGWKTTLWPDPTVQNRMQSAMREDHVFVPTRYQPSAQKHFRWTMVGPDSSYSPLEIHICWKVLSDDRMEPPIHTEYLRSGGATTLIFIVEGARAVSSLVIRSPMPGNMVVPPESTTLA